MIVIALIVGMLLGGLIIYWVESRPSKLSGDFEDAKKQVVDNVKTFYEKKVETITQNYEQKRKQIVDNIAKLDEQLAQAEEKHQLRLTQLQEETIKSVEVESQRRATSLAGIQEYYDAQERQVQEDFEHFKAALVWDRKELEAKLKKEEEKYNEIIEQFKRQEQIKQQKDFYRIILKENELEDIKKLKTIAAELHDPSILYKLIYKTYYERPFNEMVGRVVTGRGDTGIYKITNINDGRVYIGQTRQAFKERWRTHVKRGLRAEPTTNNKLYAAMWEEGVENFTFEVLSECQASDLNAKEKDFISLYHGDTWGYNSTGGNNGT